MAVCGEPCSRPSSVRRRSSQRPRRPPQECWSARPLREALRQSPRAAGDGVVPLPLPEPVSASAASARRELAAHRELARAGAPAGRRCARTRDLAGLAASCAALGAEPELLHTIGVLAATRALGRRRGGALRDDPRVAYIERDRTLRVAADPFDIDRPRAPGDQVHMGLRRGARRRGPRRRRRRLEPASSSVIDTGLDVNHPEFAGQVARVFDTTPAART